MTYKERHTRGSEKDIFSGRKTLRKRASGELNKSRHLTKRRESRHLTKTEKSHYTKEKRETLGKVNKRHQNKKIPRVNKIFILLEGFGTEVYKIYIRGLSTSMRLSISFLFVSVSKTIMEE